MCGIFFSLSHTGPILPDASTEQLLKHRGPDSKGTLQTEILVDGHRLCATFVSTVLALRGTSIVEQPLSDSASGSIFAWNGEAWAIAGQPISGNDSQRVFDSLLATCKSVATNSRTSSLEAVTKLLCEIRGPFAFVFYDALHSYIYYGRDCLGRRSLLRKSTPNNELILSSVCESSGNDKWVEVEAEGLYVVDLKGTSLHPMHIPHRARGDIVPGELSWCLPFPTINRSLPSGPSHPDSQHVQALEERLRTSLNYRIQHVRESVTAIATGPIQGHARVAILFSGGLDCTILARISHDLLPPSESIDLLNVAFENPRIHSKLDEGVSPYELCPDRVTGRTSHAELFKVCPGRCWRFVEINVPYSKTTAHRARVVTLMHPHNTEMDLSISFALYFASQGVGIIRSEFGEPPQSYTTPAHVLLSGLGADELFGGYGRHAVAFSRQGYAGLIDELDLDFNRIGKRNLGRDDRVISHSGREVRFPYLDEDFIAVALDLPVWAKCDFENAQLTSSDEPARLLEPGKRVLRLLAWQLGMKTVAAEKKRAIQFGARTAKMETGRTKGTQSLS